MASTFRVMKDSLTRSSPRSQSGVPFLALILVMHKPAVSVRAKFSLPLLTRGSRRDWVILIKTRVRVTVIALLPF